MKSFRVRVFIVVLSLVSAVSAIAEGLGKNISEFNVSPTNAPEINSANLQKAIDWATSSGAVLFVDPSDEPYPINSGIQLKKNVSLVGANGPTARGTKNPTKNQPVGSVFAIQDAAHPFITVESATRIEGIQFWYPKQELRDPSKIIPYPPTIQVDKTKSTQGVMLSRLTFYGEFESMDFNAKGNIPCELMTFEHCYGYPLSGKFLSIDFCYDIPRVLHCHVNPAIMREFGGHLSREIVDSVIGRKTFAYNINHTDNAQLIDVFTFATWGGIYLGEETYGQLTNFNLDCVAVGIHKKGSQNKNRNWQIAQGSIIANTGGVLEDIHPIIIEGMGHTALSNVEAFSGDNGALTNLGKSQDYMLVKGDKKLTVSLVGCRMRNYVAEKPLTIQNPNAIIQAVACIDNDEKPFNFTTPLP